MTLSIWQIPNVHVVKIKMRLIQAIIIAPSHVASYDMQATIQNKTEASEVQISVAA